MRLDRLLAITVMLLNRDRVTAREFADRFEVTVRTIYRDVEALSLAGIPVVSYQGNNGGFGLVENYRWDRQLLTMNDMVSMLTALKGVNETLEDGELDTAIEKVTALVPPDRAAELEEGLEQFVVDMEPWGGAPRLRERIRSLHRAVVEHRTVRFAYSSAKGEDTVRVVEPMTLILKGYTWYLFGFCRARDDFRVFRLSRMRSLEPLRERFRRKEASYRDYLDAGAGRGGTAGRSKADASAVRLRLRFAPAVRFLVEDHFAEADRTTLDDGAVEVRATFPRDRWVDSMILAYGDQVEVLEPKWMRDRIADVAGRVRAMYEAPNQT